jgi:hypothetical protein
MKHSLRVHACVCASDQGACNVGAVTSRSDTDPTLLAKVGDFFMSHSQYDKAVQLFVTGKQVVRALELCEKYNVTVTEDVSPHTALPALASGTTISSTNAPISCIMRTRPH